MPEVMDRWVVWGVGVEPERAAEPETDLPGEEPNEIAVAIAQTTDPEWAEDRGPTWVRIVDLDEQDVDTLLRDDPNVRGYAGYLPGEDASVPDTRPQRGVLRRDVVRRRPFDAGRIDEHGPGGR
ncbi:MAG TPA: hypothetical protein VF129_03685 [Actinomycetota bacterium]